MLCTVAIVPAARAQTPGDQAPPQSGGSAPPSGGSAPTTSPSPSPTPGGTGGAQYGFPDPQPTVPGFIAQVIDGVGYAPAAAPLEVQKAIWAANRIIGKPYRYGGGHNKAFKSSGYDCSGTVSYALHGGGLLKSPLDSSSFMRWGKRGTGDWITVYTNPSHAFMVIAGIRLDTSASGDPSGNKGPRWRPVLRSTRGFHARHPANF
jgi:cell wall-associated NlpC family hydrolase